MTDPFRFSKFIICNLMLMFVLIMPGLLHAEMRVEQKLILVSGTESRFMDGEPRPVFDFQKDEVLPYLLARGWKISSVHIDEKSKAGTIAGYVVVEREYPSGGLHRH